MARSARTSTSAPVGKRRRDARIALLTAVLAAAALAAAQARAATLTTLYDFCAQPNCADGQGPNDGLIEDEAGNLYGITRFGGKFHFGTVFSLTRNQAKPEWTETVLYDFCASGCGDGAGFPTGSLLMGPSGELYGATGQGGLHGQGSIFELTFDQSTHQWNEKTLYNFAQCPPFPCPDGRFVNGSLVMSPTDGTLFGTTENGGNRDEGTVFALIPDRGKTTWKHVVLYSFCSIKRGRFCLDGNMPMSGLVLDSTGRLYGTTAFGGKRHFGTVFELVPQSATVYTENVLHFFCRSGLPACNDGASPQGLVMTADEQHFFGTTGGSIATNQGVVFELTRKPTPPWPSRVLYSFCSLPNCADGGLPYSRPRLVLEGNRLFGTAAAGNPNGGGTAFELTPARPAPWRVTILYSFCQLTGCSDGENPYGGLAAAAGSKNLYGVTSSGGANNNAGTVFEISP